MTYTKSQSWSVKSAVLPTRAVILHIAFGMDIMLNIDKK